MRAGSGFGKPSPYRDRLLARKVDVCRKIADGPDYETIRHKAGQRPITSLIGDVAQAIKHAFAQGGAKAALLALFRRLEAGG